jgi:adenylate cyclase
MSGMVRVERLELPRLSAPEPKSGVSANSTIPANAQAARIGKTGAGGRNRGLYSIAAPALEGEIGPFGAPRTMLSLQKIHLAAGRRDNIAHGEVFPCGKHYMRFVPAAPRKEGASMSFGTDAGDGVSGTPRRTISLRWLLALAFGGLVFVSVAAVLALSVRANFINTYGLLGDRAVMTIGGIERSIRMSTVQAERTVEAIAELNAKDALPHHGGRGLDAVLSSFMAAAPVLDAVVMVGGRTDGFGLVREDSGDLVAADPQIARILAERLDENLIAQSGSAVWSDPVEIDGQYYHTVSRPLYRDGQVEGLAVALMGAASINRVLEEIGNPAGTAVFLLTGDGHVIGHSQYPGEARRMHFPPVKDFPDPVLQQWPDAKESEVLESAARFGVETRESGSRMQGHVFLTRPLPGYASQPYTLGAYFPKAQIGEEVRRAVLSMAAGIAGLAAAVIAAIMLGARLSRPMVRIADTASAFSEFRLEEIRPLPRSPVREIDRQAEALNRMGTALAQFARYVPRSLVARLIVTGEDAARPIEREVTILFTDICGFTALTEKMDASAVASLLNHHFAAITREVEAKHGLIDKFIGDGAMAFWGAPDADPDHAANAVAAARAIARVIIAENKTRRAAGLQPVRIRIGIHTGSVIVGNIGGADRQNYTIVGDAVNVAQRLEQHGKALMSPQDDAIVLASAQTVEACGKKGCFSQPQKAAVRGRADPVEICRLTDLETELS